MNNDYAVLTVEDVCRILGVGRNKCYTLLQTGAIKAFKEGRTWKIARAAVNQYVKTQSRL